MQSLTERYKEDKKKSEKTESETAAAAAGGAGGGAGDNTEEQINEFEKSWVNWDPNVAKVDIGTFYKQVQSANQTLLVQCGIDVLGKPEGGVQPNVNIHFMENTLGEHDSLISQNASNILLNKRGILLHTEQIANGVTKAAEIEMTITTVENRLQSQINLKADQVNIQDQINGVTSNIAIGTTFGTYSSGISDVDSNSSEKATTILTNFATFLTNLGASGGVFEKIGAFFSGSTYSTLTDVLNSMSDLGTKFKTFSEGIGGATISESYFESVKQLIANFQSLAESLHGKENWYTKDQGILQKIEPSYVTVRGQRIGLLCSWRAAAMMEEALGTCYQDIAREILGVSDDAEDAVKPMSIERSMRVVECLMLAAGEKVTRETLESLHATEAVELTQAAMREMLYKAPIAKKNA